MNEVVMGLVDWRTAEPLYSLTTNVMGLEFFRRLYFSSALSVLRTGSGLLFAIIWLGMRGFLTTKALEKGLTLSLRISAPFLSAVGT